MRLSMVSGLWEHEKNKDTEMTRVTKANRPDVNNGLVKIFTVSSEVRKVYFLFILFSCAFYVLDVHTN